MRPVTKIVLVLVLIGLIAGALFIASRDWSDLGTYESPGPAAATRTSDGDPTYDDPVAIYQRWRDRLERQHEADRADTSTGRTPAPAPPSDPPAPAGGRDMSVPAPTNPAEDAFTIDLDSSSRDEGTIVAGGQPGEVAGADPPGPILRPEGLDGDVVTVPLRPRTTDPKNTYVIQSGDTLYDIALEKYGDAAFVQAIEKANPGLNASRLRVGASIVLPDKQDRTPAEPKPKRQKVYVVRKGDTLIGIARRMYNDAAVYPKIYEANKDVLSSLNARLYIGMRLRLPEPE